MNAFLVSSVAIFSTSDRNIPMHLLSWEKIIKYVGKFYCDGYITLKVYKNLWPGGLNALKIKGNKYKNYILQNQKTLHCFKTIHST
jgi:hypothetical protein